MRALESLRSRGFVREQFAWRHYYWYLTNEGIQHLHDLKVQMDQEQEVLLTVLNIVRLDHLEDLTRNLKLVLVPKTLNSEEVLAMAEGVEDLVVQLVNNKLAHSLWGLGYKIIKTW